ncbi:MAG: hypothetical protein HY791_09290 [Deltaproteobacteria bacterium]|nr:hypothetical protein [Deltaproteobacteria bacterium]
MTNTIGFRPPALSSPVDLPSDEAELRTIDLFAAATNMAGWLEDLGPWIREWASGIENRAPLFGARAPEGAMPRARLELQEEVGRRAVRGAGLELARPVSMRKNGADATLSDLQSGAIDVARRELDAGVRVDPRLGANRGDRVDEYAKDAKMQTGLPWCGFFAQYAYGEAARTAGGERTERMQLHSMQKARSYFMYRDYTNASASRNQQLDQLASKQEAEGSARRYLVVEGSSGERFAKLQKRPHESYSLRELPLRPGDVALFSKGHIGLVEKYDQATGRLTTIEGNSTGGAVRRTVYDLNDPRQRAGFEGFGRPALSDFELPDNEPTETKSGREAPKSEGASRPATSGVGPRPESAVGGRAFMAELKGLPPAARESAILREVEKGNLPEFLRELKPVSVSFVDSKGQRHEGQIRVMPDYLAIGSNDDFVRVPMTPKTAQAVADRLGCVLPTRKMVDQIYAQSTTKLTPQPMTKDREKVATFEAHNRLIEGQLGDRGAGELVSGHKKDIVMTRELAKRPNKVAIYGWHQPDGKPIQPLSTIHDASYLDYSHGARMVAGTMIVDGRERSVAEVLADKDLAGLLSDEGPIATARVAR